MYFIFGRIGATIMVNAIAIINLTLMGTVWVPKMGAMLTIPAILKNGQRYSETNEINSALVNFTYTFRHYCPIKLGMSSKSRWV